MTSSEKSFYDILCLINSSLEKISRELSIMNSSKARETANNLRESRKRDMRQKSLLAESTLRNMLHPDNNQKRHQKVDNNSKKQSSGMDVFNPNNYRK